MKYEPVSRARPPGAGPPRARAHFVRFGLWPADERSRNFVTGKREDGVSVYYAEPHFSGWQAVVPEMNFYDGCPYCGGVDAERCEACGGTGKMDELDWQASTEPMDSYNSRSRDHRRGLTPAFLVTGRLVGVGHDGEPLLCEVRELRQLEPEDLARPIQRGGFDSVMMELCSGCARCSSRRNKGRLSARRSVDES